MKSPSRNGVCAILVFLNLLEGHPKGITQVGLAQSQLSGCVSLRPSTIL